MMEERPLDHVFDAVSRSHGQRRHMGPTQQLYHDTNVAGVNRHKYFKRPLRHCLHRGMPPQVLFAPARPAMGDAGARNGAIAGSSSKRVSIREPVEGDDDVVDITADDGDGLTGDGANSRTFGTQTMYRESEAQTDPYTADYYVAGEGEVEPEVLSLTHLSYAAGTLPAGLPEIEAIERARARRQFEMSLQPVSEGPHALEQRRRMLKHQEVEDLKRRENELVSMQNARFDDIRAELRERERAIEDDHREKVERFARACATDLDRGTANIHARRIKAQRRVLKERHALDASLSKKPSIIDKYADYGSTVYAPVARDGCRLDEQARVSNPLRASLAGLNDVENRFRHHFVVSPDRMRAPHVVAKKYRSRKGQKLAAILDFTLNQFDEERRRVRMMQSRRMQDGSTSTLLGGGGSGSGSGGGTRDHSARSASSARMRILAEREEAQRAKLFADVISPVINDIVDIAHRVAEFDSPVNQRSEELEETTPTDEEVADAEVARAICETLTLLDIERHRAADMRRIEEEVARAERVRVQREAEESGRRQRDGFEPAPEDYIDADKSTHETDAEATSQAEEASEAIVNEDTLSQATELATAAAGDEEATASNEEDSGNPS